MTLENLLNYFKTKSAVAKALDISPQAIQQWFDDKKIPLTRQYQIQVLTKGKLKVSTDGDKAA